MARKRSADELEDVIVPPSEGELLAFMEKYPMDSRASTYLRSSSGNIQARVLRDFKPKPPRGDEDYSALVTSFVAGVFKRLDVEGGGSLSGGVGGSSGSSTVVGTRGGVTAVGRTAIGVSGLGNPTVGTPPPRRPPSGAVVPVASASTTTLARTGVSGGGGATSGARRRPGRVGAVDEDGGSDSISIADLNAFRRKYPMDDEAWDHFRSFAGPIQAKVIQDFRPKKLGDGFEDYSAVATSFVTSVARRYKENPDGFRRGLGLPLTLRGSDEEVLANGRGGERAPQTDSRDVRWFCDMARQTPAEYLALDYSITCMMPNDRCGALLGRRGQNMAMVEQKTGTRISLAREDVDGGRDGHRVLNIVGPLTAVYGAHMLLMKAYNDANREAPPEAAALSKIEALQRQLADLKREANRLV
eukprot:TRINITY_DN75315_c0_g1_i1.p1 TRINITY_DN75315_c0_g1~~TRINITY_DN75315_c0_g1_i1.p1  ORF type:complete len:415 (-),score=82.61 TRINITY_DN75315_c0_g1_i1:189-1433(-)